MTLPPEGETEEAATSFTAEQASRSASETEPNMPTEAPQDDATRLATPWFRVIPGCLLAWAVPGLGHAVLGRMGRGLLLGGLVLSLFAGGLALEGKVYRPVEGDPLSYLAAFGAAGVGVPFLIAHARGLAEGDIRSAYHDYGNTFTLVAGLLNLLLVLDAYDIALGRR